MNDGMELIVITGISGAGKSTALNCVEDMGYYSMDNIPPQLLSKFVELYLETGKKSSKVAVVLDIRTREFFDEIITEFNRIEELGIKYKIMFLDASDEIIIKRYKEFRRPHPLAPEGNIIEGLREEREILEFLKRKSTYVIDTSRLTIHKLRAEILEILGKEGSSKIQVSIVSFGFKNGILLDADFVFDARFLKNPYYIIELRHQTGYDKDVIDYILANPLAVEYIDHIESLINFVVPEYIKEGKLMLTIGVGCTGGKHRSVCITNELEKRLESKDLRIVTDHRDIDR